MEVSLTLPSDVATSLDWSAKIVKFEALDGSSYTGRLAGWDEEGFILRHGDAIQIAPYNNLYSWIKIQTPKRNTDKGIKAGLYAGTAGTVLLFIAAAHTKYQGNYGMTGLGYAFAIPAIFVVSTCIGAFIGARSYQYKKYIINIDEFKSQPHEINYSAFDGAY